MTEPSRERERADMIREQVERRGVRDPRVLGAMARLPRERFVPRALRAHAYEDRALAIDAGQTISQPYIVAAMSEALALTGDERVLEIGTGSGYQAAVLAHLAAEVYTVERHAKLSRRAARILRAVGCDNVRLAVGDGSRGWPDEAPFHATIVTAAAAEVPPSLLAQLDPDGGRLVAPVGPRELQRLVRVIRDGTTYVTEELMKCRFVPLLGHEGWAEP